MSDSENLEGITGGGVDEGHGQFVVDKHNILDESETVSPRYVCFSYKNSPVCNSGRSNGDDV